MSNLIGLKFKRNKYGLNQNIEPLNWLRTFQNIKK